MKRFFLISSIFIALDFFWSCNPIVTFEQPQPENTKNFTKIPKYLQGKYLYAEDSTFLFITENMMYLSCNFQETECIKDLDSNYILCKESIKDLKNNILYPVTLKEDTVLIHINYIDTLFQFNEKYVLRKYKGYYFINENFENQGWEVKKLSLKKGILTVSSIESKKDIELLKDITQDTIPPYSFKPTKKQFKAFIKKEGFGKNDTFVKCK